MKRLVRGNSLFAGEMPCYYSPRKNVNCASGVLAARNFITRAQPKAISCELIYLHSRRLC